MAFKYLLWTNLVVLCWLVFSASSAVLERPAKDLDTAETGGHGGGAARTQYHEQGLDGPESYRFGYDTADPYNRLTRHETKDGYGIVRGRYTYVDHYGKEKVVEYMSHPKYGFRAKGHFGEFPRQAP